jgi:4-amino-4-deoxy-L-arabinose transferase-like glycosyltransferase
VRVGFFFFSQANGGDAFARAAITAKWLQHPNLSLDFGGPNWPPLHFWLMALVAQVVPNVLLACRLLSLLAGLFSLWLFWRLVVLLYDEAAGLLSLTIFVFYSLHIAYATASSSEEIFLAFALGGLLGVFAFRSSPNYAYLIAGGLSLTAAAAVRYEAWVLIFAVAVLFLLDKEGQRFASSEYWKALVIFGISSGLWPVFWAVRSWIRTGHPLYSLSYNRELVPGQLAVFPEHGTLYQLALTPAVLLLTLTPLAILGALYGFWTSYRYKKSLDFTLLVIFFGAFQLVTAATGGVVLKARFTLVLGTLCAAIAGYGLIEIGKLLRFQPAASLSFLTIIMVLNLAFIVRFSRQTTRLADKFRSISPLMQFSVHLDDVGQFLRPRIQPADNLIIDNFNDEPNLVGVAIGLPLLTGDRVFTAGFNAKTADPFPYIISHHPRYAVLSLRGSIGASYPLPRTCSESWILRDINLRCIHENELYRVYEITRSELH